MPWLRICVIREGCHDRFRIYNESSDMPGRACTMCLGHNHYTSHLLELVQQGLEVVTPGRRINRKLASGSFGSGEKVTFGLNGHWCMPPATRR